MAFSTESERALRNAGWKPGRKVDIGDWIQQLEDEGYVLHGAARDFLQEFGGLFVDVRGAGRSRARVPFQLDPMLCSGESDRFGEWGQLLSRSFAPIGDLDGGRYFLAIDENGNLYIMSDWVACLGQGRDAMEKLILGIAAEEIA